MLSDNGVLVDSRVQKEAVSSAAAGWDVVLLGTTRRAKPVRWSSAPRRSSCSPPPGSSPPAATRTGADSCGDRWPTRPASWPTTARAWCRPSSPTSGCAGPRPPPDRPAARVPSSRAGPCSRSRPPGSGCGSGRARRLATARAEMTSPLDRFTTRFWQTPWAAAPGAGSTRGLRDLELRVRPGGRPAPARHRPRERLPDARRRRPRRPRARTAGRDRQAGLGRARVPARCPTVGDHAALAARPKWPTRASTRRTPMPWSRSPTTLADLLSRPTAWTSDPPVVLNAPADGGRRRWQAAGPARALRRRRGHAARGLQRGGRPAAGPGHHGRSAAVAARPARRPRRRQPGRPPCDRPRTGPALGVADRVHVVPYVPHDQVVGFLAGGGRRGDPDPPLAQPRDRADHEVLRVLPRAAADRWSATYETMAAKVRATGQGEVFRPRTSPTTSPRCGRSSRSRGATGRRTTARAARGWTWAAQSAGLDRVYSRVRRAAGRRDVSGAGTPDVTVVVAVLQHHAVPDRVPELPGRADHRHWTGWRSSRSTTAPPTARARSSTASPRCYPGTVRVVHQANSGGPAAPQQPGAGAGHRPVRLLPRRPTTTSAPRR